MSSFKILFMSQILMLRGTLPFFIFLQTVMPAAFVFAMGHYAGVSLGQEQLVRIVGGTITFNLAFSGLSSMANRIAYMRKNGLLTYYISLPLDKVTFISALLSARLVLLLPGLVIPIVAAKWIYNLDLQLSLWLIVVLLLGTFTLATVGTALGIYIKSPELVNVLTGALIFTFALLAPTFMPSKVLPLPLQWLGWGFPTTYVSDALTRVLQGIYDGGFWLDVLVLLGMATTAAGVAVRFLSWRIE